MAYLCFLKWDLTLTHWTQVSDRCPLGYLLVKPFVYFHTSWVRTAKAVARLCQCTGSPEPSLVTYVISTIISWACHILCKIRFGIQRSTVLYLKTVLQQKQKGLKSDTEKFYWKYHKRWYWIPWWPIYPKTNEQKFTTYTDISVTVWW